MNRDLSDKRKIYSKETLLEENLPENPFELFKDWYDKAENTEAIEEANAMSITTIGEDHYPKTRIVLLKQFNEEGFIFFTNYNSDKGKAIAFNNHVCISFFWPALERQIIIKGQAVKTSKEISDNYFNSRPIGSRLGALASDQSDIIANRQVLEDKLKDLEVSYKDSLPKRPEHWGGYIIHPISFEFWQGRPNRLHDRIIYDSVDNKWCKKRLSP